MIWWILGAIGLVCAFVVYCCVVVGARADRLDEEREGKQ